MAAGQRDLLGHFTGTKEVAPAHRVDPARLAEFLEANIDGFRGPLEVREFRGG